MPARISWVLREIVRTEQPLSVAWRVTWGTKDPPHGQAVTTPFTVHAVAQHATAPGQPPFAHVIAHVAPLHATFALQADAPSHVISVDATFVPLTSPVHASLPSQRIAHDVAVPHSTFAHADCPMHETRQGMFAGHLRSPQRAADVQVKTQLVPS